MNAYKLGKIFLKGAEANLDVPFSFCFLYVVSNIYTTNLHSNIVYSNEIVMICHFILFHCHSWPRINVLFVVLMFAMTIYCKCVSQINIVLSCLYNNSYISPRFIAYMYCLFSDRYIPKDLRSSHILACSLISTNTVITCLLNIWINISNISSFFLHVIKCNCFFCKNQAFICVYFQLTFNYVL